MQTRGVLEPVLDRKRNGAETPPKRPLWREALMRRAGKVVLAVCPKGRAPCDNINCALRALCACAQADLAAARRLEGRVWLVVGTCGVLAILIALIRALVR